MGKRLKLFPLKNCPCIVILWLALVCRALVAGMQECAFEANLPIVLTFLVLVDTIEQS